MKNARHNNSIDMVAHSAESNTAIIDGKRYLRTVIKNRDGFIISVELVELPR